MAHFINDTGFWDESLPTLRAKYRDRELLFLAESYGTDNNLALFKRGMGAGYDDDLYKVCQFGYARDETGQSVIALSQDAQHNGDFADKLAAFTHGGMAAAVERALLNYTDASAQGRLNGTGRPVLLRYTDNHDEGRAVFRYGPGAARAMNQLIFMAPDTMPMLLTGQEFGAENRPPIHQRIGTCEKGYRVVTAAGSDTREGIEFEGNCFARGLGQRQDWYHFYRELLALRATQPALRRGNFALLDVQEDAPDAKRSVIAFRRTLDATTLHCAINLGPQPRRLGQKNFFAGDVLYGQLENDVLPPFAGIITRV